jgi:hypothetical protein
MPEDHGDASSRSERIRARSMKRAVRRGPPDAMAIAARFGIEPASEEAGKAAYILARALGTANNIATWDETRGTEEYAGATWQTFCSGLSERDKLCWRLIAAAAGAR